ncbi:hypothetical protein ACYFX5_08875 [Bremerella sp. T1]|uniref:hypothetical protein n=1 Tax=Bremerella sp. TYQ1 TaxID=3119568 RepID=UPI001CCA2787|nr:hypothetical protein [Bremerella volcania]UBM38367.1 hypothetical protein LA756_10805 [Bremerella volcania]
MRQIDTTEDTALEQADLLTDPQALFSNSIAASRSLVKELKSRVITLDAVVRLANSNGKMWASVATLSYLAGLPSRTVEKHLAKLVEQGYLLKLGRRGRRSVTYQVTAKYWSAISGQVKLLIPRFAGWSWAELIVFRYFAGSENASLLSARNADGNLGAELHIRRIATIAATCSLARQTILSALERLESRGVIEVDPEKGGCVSVCILDAAMPSRLPTALPSSEGQSIIVPKIKREKNGERLEKNGECDREILGSEMKKLGGVLREIPSKSNHSERETISKNHCHDSANASHGRLSASVDLGISQDLTPRVETSRPQTFDRPRLKKVLSAPRSSQEQFEDFWSIVPSHRKRDKRKTWLAFIDALSKVDASHLETQVGPCDDESRAKFLSSRFASYLAAVERHGGLAKWPYDWLLNCDWENSQADWKQVFQRNEHGRIPRRNFQSCNPN